MRSDCIRHSTREHEKILHVFAAISLAGHSFLNKRIFPANFYQAAKLVEQTQFRLHASHPEDCGFLATVSQVNNNLEVFTQRCMAAAPFAHSCASKFRNEESRLATGP